MDPAKQDTTQTGAMLPDQALAPIQSHNDDSPTLAGSTHSDPEKAEGGLPKDGHDDEEASKHYVHGLKLVLVFIGLASSMFVIILDQTILIPAIPVIASDFNAIGQIGWISSSYFVTQCASILIWGQVLAMFNQKTPLLISIAIFELGSLIAALSKNFIMLIVGRAIAGIGGAAIMVACISISSAILPLEKRPVFFGMFGLIFVLGSTLGPIIGGTFTDKVTWRWCFWINLPIGGISIVTAAFCVPRLDAKPPQDKAIPWIVKILRQRLGESRALADKGWATRTLGLDWIATVIVLGSTVSLTLALTEGGSKGWSGATVIGGFTASGVGLILLILWELFVMKEDGMVPIRVARFRGVWGAAGCVSMRMISGLATLSYLPTFMQATRHQSPIQSAVSVFPYAIGMALFALMGAATVQKTGRVKWALCLGSIFSAIAGGLLYTIKADTAYARIAGFQIIGAFGAGLIMMNAALAAQAEMDMNGLKADIPQATALVSLLQLLGGSLGGSIGGALLTSGLRRYLPDTLPAATKISLQQSVETIWTLSGSMQTAAIDAYARALDDVFILGSAASVLGLGFALITRDINIKGKKLGH